MTQEEKQILLNDLCVRLPHGVHCCVFKLNEKIKENDDILYGVIGDNVITLKCDEDECLMYYQIKPYLRPMSSMTEEERYTYRHMLGATLNSEGESIMFVYVEDFHTVIDWLLSKHFDYRGLIEKGLALEAPEDMYKTV